MGKTKLLLSLMVIVVAVALVGGATLAWFTASDSAEDISFQAGTLLIDAGSSLIYGVEQRTGRLYEIDVVSGEETLLFDGTTNDDSDINYPNALAYDRNNQRLYYANKDGSLKFHEIGTTYEVTSGDLVGRVAGATFGRGYYWYIPQGSSTLFRATFDSDGILTGNEPYIQNITDTNGNYITFASFGDIAMEIKDNSLYGSARVGENGYRYFVINLTTKETEMFVVESVNNMLQLAFGADGQLYGHTTVSKQWFSIDTATGNRGDSIYTGSRSYTDLASNWQNNWNPGDCDMARFYVRNTGTKNSYIRVSWRAGWTDLDFEEEGVVVEVTPCDDDNWLPNDSDDGYLYYQTPLAPGEKAILCLMVCLKDKETGNPYQGKTFELKPEFEAIQWTHDASQTEWGWTPPSSDSE